MSKDDTPADAGVLADEGGETRLEGDGADQRKADGSGPYLGTWKTRDAAEKGVGELQKAMDRFRLERDRYSTELDKLRTEVLAKLAERETSSGPKKKGLTEDDLAKLRERVAEEPAFALDVTTQWLGEVQKAAQEYADSKFGSMERELQALREQLISASPEYQQYKGAIEKLKAAGVPTQKAVEIAKELMGANDDPTRGGNAAAVRTLPGGSTGGNAAVGAGMATAAIDPNALKYIDALVPGGLTDEERKRLMRRR